MCQPISLVGLEIGEMPGFIESLDKDEREGLIIGDVRYFDEPLREAIESMEGEERMKFVREVVAPLDKEERKMLFEITAFDALSVDEFAEFRSLCLS